MANKDYYSVLGVSKTATQEEIKKAYKKLAVQNHPDKHQENKDVYEKKFKEINEAYSVLSDPAKRGNYDQFGTAEGGFGGGGNGDFSGFGGFDFNVNDIFDSFFNQGSGRSNSRTQTRSSSQRGSDLRYVLEISLQEAFYGCSKNISFKALSKCNPCNGTGSSTGKKEESICKTCKGSGSVRIQRGFFIVEQTCQDCMGEGQILKNPCSSCGGEGRSTQKREVNVTVPRGVDDETNLKIAGAGEAGIKGGSSGDLYVKIKVATNSIFTRKENDLHMNLPIKFTTAILGGKIKIKGIDNTDIIVDIPRCSQNNQIIKISECGMSVYGRDRRGYLIIHLEIENPVKITQEQEELLLKLDQSIQEKSHPKTESFFDSIKRMFS